MIESLLFESWLALLIVGVLSNFAALVHWRRGGSAKPLLATMAIALLWWIAQAVVDTPTEIATRLLREVEEDVVASKTSRLAAVLAADFSAGDMDRERFVDLVKGRLRTFDVRSLSRVRLEVLNREPKRFRMGVTYWASVARGNIDGYIKSLWQIEFAKNDRGWKISRIEPEEINEMRIQSWQNLPRGSD